MISEKGLTIQRSNVQFICSLVLSGNQDFVAEYLKFLIPSLLSAGARVFARGDDNLYYRGFVKNTSYHGNTLYINVQLDQSGSISHQASDERAIVLDVIPLYSHVHATQRVIGYYPGYSSYLPGTVLRRNVGCWKSAYRVRFDMGTQREQDFNDIRILPPYVQFLFFP